MPSSDNSIFSALENKLNWFLVQNFNEDVRQFICSAKIYIAIENTNILTPEIIRDIIANNNINNIMGNLGEEIRIGGLINNIVYAYDQGKEPLNIKAIKEMADMCLRFMSTYELVIKDPNKSVDDPLMPYSYAPSCLAQACLEEAIHLDDKRSQLYRNLVDKSLYYSRYAASLTNSPFPRKILRRINDEIKNNPDVFELNTILVPEQYAILQEFDRVQKIHAVAAESEGKKSNANAAGFPKSQGVTKAAQKNAKKNRKPQEPQKLSLDKSPIADILQLIQKINNVKGENSLSLMRAINARCSAHSGLTLEQIENFDAANKVITAHFLHADAAAWYYIGYYLLKNPISGNYSQTGINDAKYAFQRAEDSIEKSCAVFPSPSVFANREKIKRAKQQLPAQAEEKQEEQKDGFDLQLQGVSPALSQLENQNEPTMAERQAAESLPEEQLPLKESGDKEGGPDMELVETDNVSSQDQATTTSSDLAMEKIRALQEALTEQQEKAEERKRKLDEREAEIKKQQTIFKEQQRESDQEIAKQKTEANEKQQKAEEILQAAKARELKTNEQQEKSDAAAEKRKAGLDKLLDELRKKEKKIERQEEQQNESAQKLAQKQEKAKQKAVEEINKKREESEKEIARREAENQKKLAARKEAVERREVATEENEKHHESEREKEQASKKQLAEREEAFRAKEEGLEKRMAKFEKESEKREAELEAKERMSDASDHEHQRKWEAQLQCEEKFRCERQVKMEMGLLHIGFGDSVEDEAYGEIPEGQLPAYHLAHHAAVPPMFNKPANGHHVPTNKQDFTSEKHWPSLSKPNGSVKDPKANAVRKDRKGNER
ncbi:MAG: hypothetical protein K0R25_396 [Rickettsiaceae bacterium]|jgi:hypothetical protein|nr:hypothetical protein [Rickettsiaceae bacterium]